MAETNDERRGKCGVEIDSARRVDFTVKDGTKACDFCFVNREINSSAGESF